MKTIKLNEAMNQGPYGSKVIEVYDHGESYYLSFSGTSEDIKSKMSLNYGRQQPADVVTRLIRGGCNMLSPDSLEVRSKSIRVNCNGAIAKVEVLKTPDNLTGKLISFTYLGGTKFAGIRVVKVESYDGVHIKGKDCDKDELRTYLVSKVKDREVVVLN